MKKSILILTCLAGIGLLLNGCASTGLTASSHLTNVGLSSPNFRLVAVNVSGEASSSAVFGVSYGFGMAASQLALIPLESKRMLYKAAMENLWQNFEAANSPAANRKLALVNLRFDSESLNAFVFTRLTVAVIADVVEFQ